MQIPRRFTKKGQGPYAEVAFSCRAIASRSGAQGEGAYVEVPSHWTTKSSEVLAANYLRRAGVASCLKPLAEEGVPEWLWRSAPDDDALAVCAADSRYMPEQSAKQVFHRLAGSWAYHGWNLGYFDTEEDARAFYDETCYMLAMQMGAPNSPQWFNTGLFWAYGISGPEQGHFYFDENQGKARRSKSAYEYPQTHACFIQSVKDDLVGNGSIMDLWQREARTFKYGSGTGSNFSNIRGAREALSSGGVSSGLMRFLTVGDHAASAIKSGGVRKSAKMIIVDIDHPDTEAFIHWKVEEGQKLAALLTGARVLRKYLPPIMAACEVGKGDARFVPSDNPSLKGAVKAARAACVPNVVIERAIDFARQGFSGIEIDVLEEGREEALAMTGVHSACAVRLPNRFLEAVRAEDEWGLVGRLDGEEVETLSAPALWRQLGYALWAEGEPGLQFDTTINEWHTCQKAGRIRASNPGGEFLFLDDTACSLASLNLAAFYRDDAVDAKLLEHATRLWMVVLDISVAMGQFPSREIAERTARFRPVGLGLANLGGVLALMKVEYDSAQGRSLAAALAAVVTGTAYAVSAEMACELGAFSAYSAQKDTMLRVLGNHCAVAHGTAEKFRAVSVLPKVFDADSCPDQVLADAARRAWETALLLGKKNGFRNAQVSCIAPTGTVGQVMGCETPGIAPRSEENVDAAAVLEMMGAVQPFVSGGIAQRIVLPRTASIDDCLALAAQAWELGLKSCMLQREGAFLAELADAMLDRDPEAAPACEVTPLLVRNQTHPAQENNATGRRVLPARRGGYTQKAMLGGYTVWLHTGEYEDGTLGEVALDVDGTDPAFREMVRCYAALLSLALQYGVPLDQLAQRVAAGRFGPAGDVTGHDHIAHADSILDYLFSELSASYLAGAAAGAANTDEKTSATEEVTGSESRPVLTA